MAATSSRAEGATPAAPATKRCRPWKWAATTGAAWPLAANSAWKSARPFRSCREWPLTQWKMMGRTATT
eukprot:4171305-Lingulodinium_polyedra.AAC.1